MNSFVLRWFDLKAQVKPISPVFHRLFFPPPPCPSTKSKLTPRHSDRWIPANLVRRFVLKYQRPAGGSEHSSVCLCCADLCLPFPSSIFLLLVFYLCLSLHPSLPHFLSQHLYLSTVCLFSWLEGRVGGGEFGSNPRYHISDHISSPNEAC